MARRPRDENMRGLKTIGCIAPRPCEATRPTLAPQERNDSPNKALEAIGTKACLSLNADVGSVSDYETNPNQSCDSTWSLDLVLHRLRSMGNARFPSPHVST